MLRLLALVSRRELLARPYRVALFVGAVMVGIAMITAMRVATDNIVTGYADRLLQMSGRTDLQVTLGTGESGFDEGELEVVEGVEGVRAAAALVRGALAFDDGEVLELYGIDLLSEQLDELYDFEVLEREADDFSIINDPHAVFLPRQIAQDRGLELGDSIAMLATEGRRDYTVRGIIEPPPLAKAYGGRIAAMYLPAAQAVTGRRGSLGFSLVDQIDVVLEDGVSEADAVERISAALGNRYSVGAPAQRRATSAKTVEGLRSTLLGMSSVALLAAMFIVYATTAGLVVARAPQSATLLSLGVSRQKILYMTVVEAGALGLVGSTLGVCVGFVLAEFVAGDVAAGMSLNYSLNFGDGSSQTAGLRFFPILTQHCVGGALVAALCASIPARALLKLDPLEIRHQRYSTSSPLNGPSVFGWLWSVGVLVSGCGVLMWALAIQNATAASVGGVLATFGFVLTALPLCRLSLNHIADWLHRVDSIAGRIAAEELKRSWAHLSTTVAAIGLCIAVAIAAGSLAKSFRSSVGSWYGFEGDALVTARAAGAGWLPAALPKDAVTKIGAMPGVARVETLRVAMGKPFRGDRIAWAALSPGFTAAALSGSRSPACNDCGVALEALDAGLGVAVSANLSRRFGLGLGGDVTIGTGSRSQTLPIVAIVDDYVSDKGSVILGSSLFEQISGDQRTNFVGVWLDDDLSVGGLRSALFEADPELFMVVSTREMIDRVGDMIAQAFADVDAIQLLVVLITLAAVVNLFFSSVLQRRVEFALLRIVGASRPLVVRATLLEGAAIALVSAGLGAATGAFSAWLWLSYCYPILVGYVLHLDFSWSTVGVCFVLTLVSSLAAGWLATIGSQRGEQLIREVRQE